MFDVLLVVGFIVFIVVILYFAYQESKQESDSAEASELVKPVDDSKEAVSNTPRDEYNELIASIRKKLIVHNYDLVIKSDDDYLHSKEFWFDLGLGLYVKSTTYSWSGLYCHSNSLPILEFLDINNLDSEVDILKYQAHLNGVVAVFNCEHSKNKHWKLFLEHDFKS